MISEFKTKTLLIDGNFLLKRSIHGAKYAFNAERHIGGLYGFIMKVRSLIRSYNINKVIVFWDGENSGKLRYNIYPSYKANRESKDWYKKITLSEAEIKKQNQEKESLLWQKMRIQQYLEEFFIRQIVVNQIESDDLIAYYCQKYTTENIIIYTNDRDLCQLLEYNNVSIFLDNTNLLINKDSYYLLFKHYYKNLCLIKTLCGDSGDNIKGIKGLGEPTLLKHFPEIESREVSLNEVLEKTKQLIDIKKPLKVLQNINDGNFNEFGILGQEHYKLNHKIIDLLNPLLTRESMSELTIIAESALDDTDRGSKNLLKYFTEDGILNIYNGSFVNFSKPFYPVILREKDFLKKNQYN